MIEPTTTNASNAALSPAFAESSSSPATTVPNTAGTSKTETAALLEVLSNPQMTDAAASSDKLNHGLETIIQLMGQFLQLFAALLKSYMGPRTTDQAPPLKSPSGQAPAPGQSPTPNPAPGPTPAPAQTPTPGQVLLPSPIPVEKRGCTHTIIIRYDHDSKSGTDKKTLDPANGGASTPGEPKDTPPSANPGTGSGTAPVTPPASGTPTNPKNPNDSCSCPGDSGNISITINPPADESPAPPSVTPSPTPPPAPADKLKNVGSSLRASGEFLWKPQSEKDGKLAVLIPSSLTGRVAEVAIVSPDKKRVLQSGKFSGVGNGNRAHFRFSKSGDKFPDGAIVWIKLKDGTSRHMVIKETSARYTK